MKFAETSGMATSSLNTPIDRINMGVKVHVLCFSNAYRYFCYKGKGFTMELVTMLLCIIRTDTESQASALS